MASTTNAAPSELQGEFRANPGAHLPVILVCAVIALLCIAGIVWGIVRPGATIGGAVFLAVALGAVAIACVVAAVYFGLRMRRRITLSPSGLAYFDGRQAHQIAWGDVQEVMEEVSSVKMLGVTVDAPKLGLTLVSKAGVRCEVDQNITGYDTLGPLVSREVNREMIQRTRGQLSARQSAQFGALVITREGLRIEQPAQRPWNETLKEKLEGNAPGRVAIPGQYAWSQVAIRIVPAMEGEKLARHSTYNELRVDVKGGAERIFAWPIPLFPNFAAFVDALTLLKQPLLKEGS